MSLRFILTYGVLMTGMSKNLTKRSLKIRKMLKL